MESSVWSVSSMETKGYFRTDPSYFTKRITNTDRERARAICRCCRQPVHQNNRKRGFKGYDGGKKIKGRKRHLLVDTEGLILKAFVTASNLNDREGFHGILAGSKGLFPRLKKVWADAGYAGKEMLEVVQLTAGIQLEISKRSEQRFEIIPRRWVVERSIAWVNRYRRLSKDYEYRTTTSEGMIYMTGIRLMLRRMVTYATTL